MTVNAAFQAQPADAPVEGGAYAQPSPGVVEKVVTLADVNGVSLTGAAGTESLAVVTVQGSASGTAIPVSGSGLGGGVAQASTTAAQLGTLVQGAVTTAAPTYTNAQTDPLSLTTGGALRVVDSSTVAQASTTSGQTGGLAQGAVTTGLSTYTTAQTDPLSLDTSGRLRGMGWQFRDSAVTAQVTTTASAPTAGTVVATVTPGTAGIWEVTGFIAITGTTVGAAETNNMGLYQTATSRYVVPILVASTIGNLFAWPIPPILLNLSGADTVNVKAIGNATSGSVYLASLVCRLVG
jgi:hypothetical protein